MTTNQTIDGVPRHTLRLALAGIEYLALRADDIGTLSVQLAAELRALLDAPAVQWLAMEVNGKPWVIKEGPNADKWRTMGYELFPVEPAAQGEPVAWIVTDMNGDSYFAYDRQTPNDKPLYAEQPVQVAVALPERSNQDYAIEHAEYMALSADDVLAKFQAYGLALLACDEGGDDGEGELLENIDSARSNLQESLVELRSMVYEFRKRSAKSR